MTSRSTLSLQNNDANEIDFDYSSSSIYHNLHYLNSIESLIKDRAEMLKYKDALTEMTEMAEMNGIENLNDLLLYGLSEQEVQNLNTIDETVSKGKELLLKTLKDYDDCKNEIHRINKRIHNTEETIRKIREQLRYLTELHTELFAINEDFVNRLLEKQEQIVSELQTEAGLLICNRDRLEAIIRSLGKTYNVIKNTPMHHTCPICITREVDVYLEPCGHTICRECNKNTHCHMCRTKIRTSKSIYYS
jgi:predicted O-linked N-acetylglucosamine transferase (SPINDLY family)